MRTLLLLLLGACTHPVEPTGLPEAEAPYATLHAEATRDLQLVVDLETHLLMHATLVDEPLARAQALEISRGRLESAEEYQERLAQAVDGARNAWTIVFSADVPRIPGDEQFAADDSAPWTLHLLADGDDQPAIAVERIDAPTADDQRLYPQLNRWSSLWVARFDRAGNADELRLRVGGARGQGELIWAR